LRLSRVLIWKLIFGKMCEVCQDSLFCFWSACTKNRFRPIMACLRRSFRTAIVVFTLPVANTGTK
jgi:hypothetical protein